MTTTAGAGGAGERPERRRRLRWAERRRRLRWAVLLASAVVGGLLASFVTYGSSVEPGAALVKAIFEVKTEVTPPSGFAAASATVTESDPVTLAPPSAPTATVRLYSPATPAPGPLPVILWIHGGGFISSSADTVKDYVTLLASTGYVVANLDYSIAPGARHPVPVLQANAALAFLAAHAPEFGGDPERIFVGGDSAGAQIAGEVSALQTNPLLARSLGVQPALTERQLRGVVLFCGLYDMRTVGSTGFPALRTYLWAYTGSRTWTDYGAIDDLSVTTTATGAFPPTFISVGDADPFHSQASELAATLDGLGVPVTTLLWDGTGDRLGHEYQFDFTVPQAQTAWESTLAFLAGRS